MAKSGDLQSQFAHFKQFQVSQVKQISTIKDENAKATNKLQKSLNKAREESAILTRDLNRVVAKISKQIHSQSGDLVPIPSSPKIKSSEIGAMNKEENSLVPYICYILPIGGGKYFTKQYKARYAIFHWW